MGSLSFETRMESDWRAPFWESFPRGLARIQARGVFSEEKGRYEKAREENEIGIRALRPRFCAAHGAIRNFFPPCFFTVLFHDLEIQGALA